MNNDDSLETVADITSLELYLAEMNDAKIINDYASFRHYVESMRAKMHIDTAIFNTQVKALDDMLQNYSSAVEHMRALSSECATLILATNNGKATQEPKLESLIASLSVFLRLILMSPTNSFYERAIAILREIVELTQVTLEAHPLYSQVAHLHRGVEHKLSVCEAEVLLQRI